MTIPDNSQVQVGWICALEVEYTAACLSFDEELGSPKSKSTNDPNTYTIGLVGSLFIVVAVLPEGEYGTNAAAVVASHLLNSFPNVKFGLMVGIGGGAPTKKNDIRLGDIVVSVPGTTTGGVIQYDLGKDIQGESFVQTGHLNASPVALRTAVTALKSQYNRDGHNLKQTIASRLAKVRPRARRALARPPSESDNLIKSDVLHKEDSEGTCYACTGKEAGCYVERRSRSPEEDDDDPTIHYGIIASSNRLIRNAILRDTLANNHDILCFEMEAAGLMNHFPCIVIRGICDYADSHKNKQWQGYAAMTAAAYARNLLQKVDVPHVECLESAKEVMCTVVEQVGALLDHTIATNRILAGLTTFVQDREIMTWLSAPDTSRDMNDAYAKRAPGTGNWLLSHQKFQDWLFLSESFLWLRGVSGSGKTVLASTVIHHLQQRQEHTVYHFFSFTDSEKKSFAGMLRSLATQLYKHSTQARCILYKLWADCKTREPSRQQLQETLVEIFTNSGRTFMILDALDESTEVAACLAMIRTLLTEPGNDLHIFLTSQERPEISWVIQQSWQLSASTLELDRCVVDGDIQCYVNQIVVEDLNLVRRWGQRPEVQKLIVDTLGGKARGVFRWVACQIDSITGCVTERSLEEALQSLPATLQDTYTRYLTMIPLQNRALARSTLQILACTKRPLTPFEMARLVVVDLTRPNAFEERDLIESPEGFLDICPGLVSMGFRDAFFYDKHGISEDKVDHGDDSGSMYCNQSNVSDGPVPVLQLAHGSVKDFLVSGDFHEPFWNKFGVADTNVELAQRCVVYLAYPARMLREKEVQRSHMKAVVDAGSEMQETSWTSCSSFERCNSEGGSSSTRSARTELEARVDTPVPSHQSDLLSYARHNWIYHAKMVGDGQTSHWEAFLELITAIGKDGGLIAQYLSPVPCLYQDKFLVELCMGLTKSTIPPLHFISGHGLSGGVRNLVERGTDVNAIDRIFGSALVLACLAGHRDTVAVLLQHGADPDLKVQVTFGSALLPAITEKHQQYCQTMRTRGHRLVGTPDRTQLSPIAGLLHRTSLLQEPARLYGGILKKRYGLSLEGSLPVFYSLVELLLANGADPNSTYNEGGHEASLLHYACLHEDEQMVEILLRYNAKASDLEEAEQGILLYHACRNNNIALVKFLMNRGANPNEGPGNNTPLMAAYAGQSSNCAATVGTKRQIEEVVLA